MATVTDDFPAFAYTPTDEELIAERQYWEEMDRIAEYDAYVAELVETDEHGYDDLCDCDECRATADEHRAMDREYERAIRGY